MGSLRSRGRYTYLCIVFRCWTRLHSMDDYSRVIQSRTTTSRDVHRRTRQLAGEFSCRSLLLTSQGKLRKKKVFSPTNAFLFKFLPLTTLNRRRCTITFSYHSAYCWHFSGFSLTRSFLRRKTKLLTKSQHYFAAMIGKEFFNHFFSNKIFCHFSYVFRHFLF